MNRIPLLLAWLLCAAALLPAQNGAISLDQIWLSGEFRPAYPNGFTWMADDRYYSVMEEGKGIAQYSVEKEKKTADLLDFTQLSAPGLAADAIESYAFGPGEQQVLLTAAAEPLYRYSTRELCFVADLKTRSVRAIRPGQKVSLAAFSPDGSRLAYVFENNLYYTDLATGAETQVTADGKPNAIINGAMDWVYEEEFALKTGFAWSPDGKRLAFYRFDESRVPEFQMALYGSLYPKEYRFKYPKAGEQNAIVSIHIYDLASRKTVMCDAGRETDQYIARIRWTPDGSRLGLMRLNRLQNQADVLLADPASGASQVFLTETSSTYIKEPNEFTWTFLKDGGLLWMSERSGFMHLYRYGADGKLKYPVTEGAFEVDEVAGIDEPGNRIYFTSTESSPMERKLYSVTLEGKQKTCLTPEAGTHSVEMSSACRYFVSSHSTPSQPPVARLYTGSGKLLRVLESNEVFAAKMAAYTMGTPRFYTMPLPGGETLNGWMIRPADFDSTRRYPVLMFVYGGPGSQEVLNMWTLGVGMNYFWFQHLAQQGYIVACVDNRGTGGRGRAFRDCTYADLGNLETQDQVSAAKYLQSLPYVDAARIGIFGWSYGGYMTLLALTKGEGVFKAGISVAPVTNWRFYDTIYTERYLKTPQLNPSGYDNNSPINFAKNLKGHLLLVHGTADDNVHFQNSMEMVSALVNANKEFDSFFYPNKNHGIYGGYTRYHLFRKMTEFLKENL
ncbi:MAG: S9 family peptidase [Bacteroidia bacterium]|nr:S9 family peptidase [Bacteroidia bacterium]